jgi:long-chain acyl-CoA synthetase
VNTLPNIASAFFESAEHHAESPAVFHRGKTWTYRALAEAVRDETQKLLSAKIPSRIPRVALDCPNGPEHIILSLAAIASGGCVIPVPQAIGAAEKSELLATTAAHALLDPNGKIHPLAQAHTAFPEDAFDALQPALVRFSSGTTGESKGVVLSHQTILDRIRSANSRLRITPADRILWTLPMAHHFAVSILLYLLQGAGIVIAGSSLPDDLLSDAAEHRATVFYGSPVHCALLAAENSGRAWPSLRLAVSTAAPLLPATAEKFKARFGIAPVQGLGLIEAGLPLLNVDHADSRPACCGIPTDFETHIAENGELLLRGPGMFDAYLSPWCTRSEAMPDGWFHTGDLAHRHPDGNIELTGRLKSAINVGGLKCFPEEIEAALDSHPLVAESRAWAEPHPRWGSVPAAEFVPHDPSHPPSPEALERHCRTLLAAHKIPVSFRQTARIDKTPSGKIRRNAAPSAIENPVPSAR